jgi:hypothetical protein
MNDGLFAWYKSMKKLIKDAGEDDKDDVVQETVEGWLISIETIEQGCPDIKERYERIKAIQDSFTPEQIDFICYEIGDWYLAWKERIIVDLDQGTHRLGYAKEQLKSMICGD